MGQFPRKCELRGPSGVTVGSAYINCGSAYISPGPNCENPANIRLHSWLISILLSRNRLRSLPGEAHVRNFYLTNFR